MFKFNFQNIFRVFKAQWTCLDFKNKELNNIDIKRPMDLDYYYSCFNIKFNKTPIFKKNTFSEHIIYFDVYFDVYKAFKYKREPTSLVYEIYVKTNSELAGIKVSNINNPYVKKVISRFNIGEEVEAYDAIVKTCFKNSVELLGGKVYDPRKY